MSQAATATPSTDGTPDPAAPAAAADQARPALCAPDCTEHETHQPMFVGPDGKLYPAPVFYRRPPGRFSRFFGRVFNAQPWIAPVAILMCMSLPIWYVLANDPTDDKPDLGACAFKAVTGFDCPGCGGTRALWYVLHGNLPEAARYHAIAVFAAPFLVYAFAAWTWRRVFPNARLKLPQFRLGPNTAAVFLSVWGAFWVIRNLPWAPFTRLFV